MKIEQYISQLLYRYPCVTVPGFGAFLTETQSAHIHEASQTFFAPKKIVFFNSNIKNNDGLLANHFAQSEKISFENAVSQIIKEVDVWKNNLQIYGGISLHNIGELFYNSEKNLVFTPTNQINYLTDSFGLTSFSSPSVKREIYKQEVEQLEEKAPISITPEKRTGSSILKYAAIFIASLGALGTAGYIGNDYYQNKIQEETLLVQTKVQEQVNQKIQEATFFIDNPLPSVTLSLNENKKVYAKRPYHVVAGSFAKIKNANQLYFQLKNAGYNPRILAKNRAGLIPVLYGSYTSYTEAFNTMQRVKQAHNPDAWLLIKE